MTVDFYHFRGRNIRLRMLAKISVPFLLIGLLACQPVQKPELKGEGPLAVVVPRGTATPEYHAPAPRWQVIHGQAIQRGDFSRRECILCHNPETGCNKCHQYVGAAKITVPESSLLWGNSKER